MLKLRKAFAPLLAATLLTGAACATAAVPAQPGTGTTALSSIGSREMGPLMDAWLQASTLR